MSERVCNKFLQNVRKWPTQYNTIQSHSTKHDFLVRMGVDHWGSGDKSPRIWRRGTLMQIVPLRFLSYMYKKEHSVAFKIRRTPRWGSSRRSSRPHSRLERGHPSPYPTPLGTDPTSALTMRPPEFQPDLRLCSYTLPKI